MRKPDSTPQVICTDASLGARLRGWLSSQAADAEVICSVEGCRQAPLCRWLNPLDPGSEGAVQVALLDAVDTLARTRHAFKSRELAELRGRLERLLKELSADNEIR